MQSSCAVLTGPVSPEPPQPVDQLAVLRALVLNSSSKMGFQLPETPSGPLASVVSGDSAGTAGGVGVGAGGAGGAVGALAPVVPVGPIGATGPAEIVGPLARVTGAGEGEALSGSDATRSTLTARVGAAWRHAACFEHLLNFIEGRQIFPPNQPCYQTTHFDLLS